MAQQPFEKFVPKVEWRWDAIPTSVYDMILKTLETGDAEFLQSVGLPDSSPREKTEQECSKSGETFILNKYLDQVEIACKFATRCQVYERRIEQLEQTLAKEKLTNSKLQQRHKKLQGALNCIKSLDLLDKHLQQHDAEFKKWENAKMKIFMADFYLTHAQVLSDLLENDGNTVNEGEAGDEHKEKVDDDATANKEVKSDVKNEANVTASAEVNPSDGVARTAATLKSPPPVGKGFPRTLPRGRAHAPTPARHVDSKGPCCQDLDEDLKQALLDARLVRLTNDQGCTFNDEEFKKGYMEGRRAVKELLAVEIAAAKSPTQGGKVSSRARPRAPTPTPTPTKPARALEKLKKTAQDELSQKLRQEILAKEQEIELRNKEIRQKHEELKHRLEPLQQKTLLLKQQISVLESTKTMCLQSGPQCLRVEKESAVPTENSEVIRRDAVDDSRETSQELHKKDNNNSQQTSCKKSKRKNKARNKHPGQANVSPSVAEHQS